jgi:thioredoxin 1
MLKIVNEQNFEQEVLKNEKLILVDFYADWCGPCRMLAPILEKMGSDRNDFDIAKLDIDKNQNLAMQYGVQSIPTMIVFKDGKSVDGMIGLADEQTIIDIVDKHIN